MGAVYIVLMGVQGSGKGTQADKLKEHFGYPHITTGGLFRAMEGQDTPLAKEIQAIMKRGELVPDHITIQVVRDRLKQPDAEKGALFDGFPRTLPQAEALDKLLEELGGKVTIVPYFKLDREIAVRRIEGRRQCKIDSNHIYHLESNPPKVPGVCDIDGGELFQRADDTREAAEKRIDLFFEKTAPLLDYYRKRGVLSEIEANQPIEQVTTDLLAALKKATG